MSHTEAELQESREFVLEQWRSKNGWTVLKEPYKQYQTGPTFRWNDEEGRPRHYHPSITRQMIRDILFEEKDLAPFFREVKIILECSNTVRYISIRTDLIFLTDNELALAFHRAYGGKECPNPHCGNSGAYPTEPDGDPEQCQFCCEEPMSKFNLSQSEGTE